MKAHLLSHLMAFILLAGLSQFIIAQEYYQFNGGNPADPVYTIYIGGSDLKPGYEVAAYDGDKLVGAMVVKNNNPFENNLAVFSSLHEGVGYVPGNPIKLNVWIADESREVENVEFTFQAVSENAYVGSVYPSGDGVFSVADVTIEPSSVLELRKPEIMIFPNPARDFIKVESDMLIQKIQLYNIIGQVVGTFAVNGFKAEVDLTTHESGLYFLKFFSRDHEWTKRLIIH